MEKRRGICAGTRACRVSSHPWDYTDKIHKPRVVGFRTDKGEVIMNLILLKIGDTIANGMKRIVKRKGLDGMIRKLDQITGNTKQRKIKEYNDKVNYATFSRGMP